MTQIIFLSKVRSLFNRSGIIDVKSIGSTKENEYVLIIAAEHCGGLSGDDNLVLTSTCQMGWIGTVTPELIW